MRKGFQAILASAVMIICVAGVAHATVIDFTGGTVTTTNGNTYTTNNSGFYQGVQSYSEDGFTLTFWGDLSNPFTSIIGDYYWGSNDVIHGHWATGNYGGLTSITVTKDDGALFDLNYFILTSNTDTGGGSASGNEAAFITANGFSLRLPVDDWGWSGPNTQVYLPSQFDSISSFTFSVTNKVDCFGMDMFYINEPPPPPDPSKVPEPGTLLLLGTGLAGLTFVRRSKKA